MGSALLPLKTQNTDTACLSPDSGGCSRKPYPSHIRGTVLPPTVEPPASTPSRPPSPPGLPHCRHSATRACRPRVHGNGLFPGWRENLATTSPSFRLRCSVLEPTRHMARTRAPDKHAKILPEPFTLPRALAGPRPAQNLHKAYRIPGQIPGHWPGLKISSAIFEQIREPTCKRTC